MPVQWLGGDTFGRGSVRFIFTRDGTDGVDELRVDQVGGVYVLRRIEG